MGLHKGDTLYHEAPCPDRSLVVDVSVVSCVCNSLPQRNRDFIRKTRTRCVPTRRNTSRRRRRLKAQVPGGQVRAGGSWERRACRIVPQLREALAVHDAAPRGAPHAACASRATGKAAVSGGHSSSRQGRRTNKRPSGAAPYTVASGAFPQLQGTFKLNFDRVGCSTKLGDGSLENAQTTVLSSWSATARAVWSSCGPVSRSAGIRRGGTWCAEAQGHGLWLSQSQRGLP
eukprot:scaffold88703_cov59-Phaeocystis_antarctica.AAC.1